MKKNSTKKLSIEEIFDLNYVLKPEFELLQKFPKRALIKTIFPGIKIFLAIFIKSLLKKKTKYPKKINGDFLFISGSQNNAKVLKPVYDAIPNSTYLDEKSTPKFWAYWYSLPYFFKALKHLSQSSGYDRKIQLAYFERFWLVYGYLIMTKRMLKKTQPKFVVVANDHLLLYRCILRVSKELNIKTVYIQHAGTAPHFPPLEFDFAILDGKISYEKYMTQGTKNTSKIFLAGSPRFDNVAKISTSRTVKNHIGIAVNTVDQFDIVKSILENLVQNKDYTYFFRPHPGIKGKLREKYIKLIHSIGIQYSDPQIESAADFLKNINLLISKSSYIQFEALLSGIQSIQLSFSNSNDDAYDFIKMGIVDEIKNLKEIDLYINKPLSLLQINYIKNNVENYNQLLNEISTIEGYKEIFKNLV
jgi:hypothetical protein